MGSPRLLCWVVVYFLGWLVPYSIEAQTAASWSGAVRDAGGKPVAGAVVELRLNGEPRPKYEATSAVDGTLVARAIDPGSYDIVVNLNGQSWKAATALEVKVGEVLAIGLRLVLEDGAARVQIETIAAKEGEKTAAQGSGGERLSSEEVSSLPLNERDFSKLLLLAAGTMTDTNGAANFTQQFSVNGERGSATVFAMDGADTSDPELGGATFSNFNVDAIQEVQSNSGVMAAEIGHGAAGFTNVVTKSGTNFMHGSAFEFLRNAALDARNFFDHPNAVNPRRIPPFTRNEFGVTIGGPVVFPQLYDGRDRTFFFGEYQGFRQVLGTTQVIPVPTAEERQGIDTLKFLDGTTDTLTVPV